MFDYWTFAEVLKETHLHQVKQIFDITYISLYIYNMHIAAKMWYSGYCPSLGLIQCNINADLLKT